MSAHYERLADAEVLVPPFRLWEIIVGVVAVEVVAAVDANLRSSYDIVSFPSALPACTSMLHVGFM